MKTANVDFSSESKRVAYKLLHFGMYRQVAMKYWEGNADKLSAGGCTRDSCGAVTSHGWRLVAVAIAVLLPIVDTGCQPEKDRCTAANAGKHVGEFKFVIDRVTGGRPSQNGYILSLGGRHSNPCLTVLVPPEVFGSSDFLRELNGKFVAVYGQIMLHDGKPEILLTSAGYLARAPSSGGVVSESD